MVRKNLIKMFSLQQTKIVYLSTVIGYVKIKSSTFNANTWSLRALQTCLNTAWKKLALWELKYQYILWYDHWTDCKLEITPPPTTTSLTLWLTITNHAIRLQIIPFVWCALFSICLKNIPINLRNWEFFCPLAFKI